MIARSPAPTHTLPEWQRLAAEAIRDPDELWHRLRLPLASLPAARRAAETFGLRVPEPFLARIRPGDPDDPLLRQVLPVAAELETATAFGPDPVGDGAARSAPGLLRKYHGRALLLASGACAVHCRYCFRRHYPYHEAGAGHWDAALDALAADPTIEEAILSGGDPLSLTDGRLDTLLERLEAIPHLRRLRLHTRQPIVIPQRVTTELVQRLSTSRLQPIVVLHANHPDEFDTAVDTACHHLRAGGATLLNQAVLLAGVNDTIETQTALSRRLFTAGILPYYLHALDRVSGASHFESPVDPEALMEGLRTRLPGYLVPSLVRENAGAPYKQPLA
ncbi:MAG: EF-P beta-lysylation protein EpmB [Pseudomonadota bacterium]